MRDISLPMAIWYLPNASRICSRPPTENISPAAPRGRLAECKYIDEVAIIGDERKFVTALVVPNRSQLMRWAEEKKFDTSDYAALLKNPKVTEFMIQQIEPYQKDLAGFERIKRLTLLPHHFSIEKGSHQHDESTPRGGGAQLCRRNQCDVRRHRIELTPCHHPARTAKTRQKTSTKNLKTDKKFGDLKINF